MDTLSIQVILEVVSESFAQLPDGRIGQNTIYAMSDAAAGAFLSGLPAGYGTEQGTE